MVQCPVPVFIAARAGQHPSDVPGRRLPDPRRPGGGARGGLGRVGAVLLVDVPERGAPLRGGGGTDGGPVGGSNPPPAPPRGGGGVSGSSGVVRGRRVVDGSSTAAKGHERQEPHQLPAHAPLYVPGRPALRSPLSFASLSYPVSLVLGQFFFLREREHSGGGETSSAPTDRPEERTNANRQWVAQRAERRGRASEPSGLLCVRGFHVIRCCFIECLKGGKMTEMPSDAVGPAGSVLG